ncbi:hypothetical protein ACHAXT_003514 [Thalassiosira profunda]
MAPQPHDAPFRYDDALVASCAATPLARSLIDGGRENDVNAPTPLRRQQSRRDVNRDCRTLFERHASHYRRPPLTDEEDTFWDAWANISLVDAADETAGPSDISPSSRIEAFLRSVLFVHEHNRRGTHRVGLNRFSDLLHHELPLMSAGSDVPPMGGGVEPLEVSAALDNLLPLDLLQSHQGMGAKGPAFVPLGDDESIMKLGEKMRRVQQQPYRSGNLSDIPRLHSGSRLLQSFRDAWWWIGGLNLRDRENASGDDSLSRHSSREYKKAESKDNSFLDDKKKDFDGGLEEKDESTKTENWDHHLDWATEDNPDGVPLVHPAMDQKLCGSCWAVSALGTLEASIARNMAYISYEKAFSSVSHSHKHRSGELTDPTSIAVLAAQDIERRSIGTADLSVQELVDCDTRYDQGCAGGNPLLAFYFLHRFGVTSSDNYPYTGKMGSCNYHKVDQPIATVESWGVLTPDHENNMEKVLRYIGPVAVGLIGADPAFLSYESGIYTSSKGGKCEFGQADHAMLITGYGEEVSKDGKVQKYWIARNSWGSGWGEKGYVKFAREGGRKGHPGVCGIARSPSVALGGMFTKDVKLLVDDKAGAYGSTLSRQAVQSGSGGELADDSVQHAPSQIRNVFHRIRARLGFMQTGLGLSTMNASDDGTRGPVVPYALPISMIAVCLLLTQLYIKRRRRNTQYRRLRSGGSEATGWSSAWSTVGLYNGIHEDIDQGGGSDDSAGHSYGERIHLLANSSGTLYTQ